MHRNAKGRYWHELRWRILRGEYFLGVRGGCPSYTVLLQFWVNKSKVISLLMNLLVSSSLSMPSHIMVAFYASSNGKAQILVRATAIPYYYARLAEKLDIRNWPTR
jgi:hypothetical protein